MKLELVSPEGLYEVEVLIILAGILTALFELMTVGVPPGSTTTFTMAAVGGCVLVDE